MSDALVYWEDLQEGREIPSLTYDFTPSKLFQMSAVTNNVHRIHYDEAWANHEGYEERVVHGPFHGEMLVQTLQRWIGPNGWLKALEFSNRRYAVLGEPLTGRGTITRLYEEGGLHLADVDIRVEKGTDEIVVTAPGTATVALPTRNAPVPIPQ